MDWKHHLARAIKHMGSQTELARAMNCSQAKISWLVIAGKMITAEDAVAIDRATNGAVSKSELRPDLWPSSQPAPAPASVQA